MTWHWLIKERHFGEFEIPMEWIEHHPLEVMQMLHEVIIIRAEFRIERSGILYTGLSPIFDPVPEAVMPLMYDVKVTREYDDDGALVDIRFELFNPRGD